MIRAVFWAWRHVCSGLGGHQHESRWRRVPRVEGGVELVEHDACTRCPDSRRTNE